VDDRVKEDRVYFAALHRQMRAGGLEALLWELQHEDLSDFDPGQRPSVDCGFDMKLRSASQPIQWWYECLLVGANARLGDADKEGNYWWDSEPQVDDLHRAYLKWAERLHIKYMDSVVHFGREIRDVCGHVRVTRPRAEDGGGRKRRYALGTLEQCRQSFERAFRVGAEIWADNPPEGEGVPF
ncbi:MAG TPA: hypothetical protein VKA04_07300, partial [Pseudodesulfovibrio sp.]|nr:hypothetical protein [Pseudodesulfovibrio sp.]